GMGLQQPEGLAIQRQFWLDENGMSLTYLDRVAGQMQQIWRLDVSEGQELGAVRIDGDGQLITENPKTGSHGVELRSRNLNLEAIGRVNELSNLAATGWQTDVDSLNATFILPPGWRAFAIFGADRVEGDWLTAWTLLDLFLLLVFAIAACRIWGVTTGVVAFFAFGLAYHEPGAPRLTWLFLLMPLALLKIVPDGTAKKLITGWKFGAVGLLAINLVPFVAHQIQTAIYPQLELPGINYTERNMFTTVGSAYRSASRIADRAYESRIPSDAEVDNAKAIDKPLFQTSNLAYDPQARIQTGPAQPQWTWNIVECSWRGPVSATQTIRPILISMQMHRVLTAVRVLLLVLLATLMLGVRRIPRPSAKSATAAMFGLAMFISPDQTTADEFPNEQMLKTLRERLLQPADAYPRAAEIAAAELTVDGNRVKMNAEVHTAAKVAVPLPGQLPVWSPVSVTIDENPAQLVCRKDGYLWIVLPQGVHRVSVESLLPDVSEWNWTFQLKPRRVVVAAPGWTVTGIGRNGVPAQQVFFSRQRQGTAGEAAYDQKEFTAIVAVDRHLEIGLVWQVRTDVTRISENNKAVSLRVPLLPEESVLTSNVQVDDGLIEVSLAAGQKSFSWSSEIPIGSDVQLQTTEDDTWIERWHLVTSPVWNMAQTGRAPVFEPHQENLVPVWHPWPGESSSLSFSKPNAVSGDTITVKRIDHTVSLGHRQREATLKLEVECSIGNDFLIGLSPDAAISSLVHDGQPIPVRRDDANVIVPVRPGQQTVEVNWKTNVPLATVTNTASISLPVEGSNATTVVQVPDSQWVLWAAGPLRGPAVRFWTILLSAILIAFVLGCLPNSPLHHIEWVLLAIGLTQVHVAAALVVVAWLFALSLRGNLDSDKVHVWRFNLIQLGLVLWTAIALAIFVVIVGVGLLGHPDMFIVGNQSSHHYLNWFQPRVSNQLPIASVVSISVWYYRLLMLFWALWLAASLLRWLKWGWTQFSHERCWKRASLVIRATAVEPMELD
ncbi:hypothetical protein ACFL2H_08450, partial [Planctomycetota bacterium]